jgi:hypothetical protein
VTAITTPDHPRSRRALLAGVLGGLGGWAASTVARVDPTAAAAGDPIRMGRLNKASGTSTELQTSTSKPAFWARQLGGGHALRAEATSGRAVMATAGSQGTGVWAYSPNHIGVEARCPGGDGSAVSAESTNGTGVLASGGQFAVNALCDNPDGVALRGSGYTAAEFNGPVRLNGWQDVRLYDETPAAPPLYAIRHPAVSVAGDASRSPSWRMVTLPRSAGSRTASRRPGELGEH